MEVALRKITMVRDYVRIVIIEQHLTCLGNMEIKQRASFGVLRRQKLEKYKFH